MSNKGEFLKVGPKTGGFDFSDELPTSTANILLHIFTETHRNDVDDGEELARKLANDLREFTKTLREKTE